MQPEAGPVNGAYLTVRGLVKTYESYVAVNGVSFDLRKGELLGLLGPSGCGKTTTLRMVAGLVPASTGSILLDGTDITAAPAYKRRIGLVFQSYALFPHMTVAGNIAFGLRMQGVAKAEIEQAVRDAVSLVQLQGLEKRYPSELSGGQQQRVALARAVAIKPTLLLLDEPLSNLDAKLRDGLRTELRELQQRLEMTAIFVTHDQAEALSICDRVAVMNRGNVEQIATPADIYNRPATPFVASFVGRVNRLAAVLNGEGVIESPIGAVRARETAGRAGKVEIMVRPHTIAIEPDRSGAETPPFNAARGRIARTAYIGDVVQYEVSVGETRIAVDRPTSSAAPPLPVGTAVRLSWSADDTMVFGREGAS